MHQENHQVLHYATLSLVFFTLLSGFVLSHYAKVSATDPSVTATATVHVAEACTLSANNTSSHNAEMSNGTYEEGIGSTTFNVKCNDASGFALYAIGYSNEEYGNTDMIGDSTSLTIPTGTEAALGSTSSHWSMKVVKDTTSYNPNNLTINNSFDSYHVVPETYTKVATYTTATDGVNGTGSSILATYDVRISGTQAAGTYIGKVKYILVHPSTMVAGTYTINYLANGGGGTAMSSETGLLNFQEHTLAQNTYTSPSWTSNSFQGWCTTNTSQRSCADGTVYADGAEIPANTVAAGGTLNLYAYWGEVKTLSEISYLQDPFSCALTTSGTVKAIIDNRDNKTYHVAKLADNKCWMLDNLALDISDSTVLSALSSTNTNASDTELSNLRTTGVEMAIANMVFIIIIVLPLPVRIVLILVPQKLLLTFVLFLGVCLLVLRMANIVPYV